MTDFYLTYHFPCISRFSLHLFYSLSWLWFNKSFQDNVNTSSESNIWGKCFRIYDYNKVGKHFNVHLSLNEILSIGIQFFSPVNTRTFEIEFNVLSYVLYFLKWGFFSPTKHIDMFLNLSRDKNVYFIEDMRGRHYLTKEFYPIMLLKINIWTSLTTEIGFSPSNTDPNCTACLWVHSHSCAESQVLPLHVTCTGFFDTCIIVSAGVHLGRGQHMSL